MNEKYTDMPKSHFYYNSPSTLPLAIILFINLTCSTEEKKPDQMKAK